MEAFIETKKGLGRLNLSLWFLRKDKLPTTDLLFWRKCLSNPLCKICGKVAETALHTVRECVWCSKIWKWLVPRESWMDFCQFHKTSEWVDFNLQNSRGRTENGLEWSIIFREAINRIWYGRNQ